MIVFVFFSIFLSSINIVLSLTMNYARRKEREYKEQLRRYSSFEEELSLMTVVLQLYKARIKNHKKQLKYIFISSLFATISEMERRSFLCFFSINDVSLSIINVYELMNYKIVTIKIENIYKLQKKIHKNTQNNFNTFKSLLHICAPEGYKANCFIRFLVIAEDKN